MSKNKNKEKMTNPKAEDLQKQKDGGQQDNGNGCSADKPDTDKEDTAEGKEGSTDDTEKEETAPKTDKELLDEANKMIEELKDKYLRQLAEFDNYKKRTLKERTELILNGSAGAVTAILPVLDDMERAMANAEKATDIKALEDGWELIFKKFITALSSLGVSKIDTLDKDFDTDYHEAVAMVPGMGDDKKGKVIDCLQTGYKLNDKVLRHAKVAVGQ